MCYNYGMEIAILGYGKEGQSAEKFFRAKHQNTTIFKEFTSSELDETDFSKYDLVLRSPSVPPRKGWSSMTQYFFEHCLCPIIGVTGTKGKGTTSTLITALLKELGHKAWLVGNIGKPALDIIDEIQPNDVVVYEMSSFQLWDLTQSPHIAVVLGIEPDHLNVHKDFADYVGAKANITKHQSQQDYCIYYSTNKHTTEIAEFGHGKKIAYPIPNNAKLNAILDQLNIPGWHNRDNAQAALLAVSALLEIDLEELLQKHQTKITKVFRNFQGLPHRLQFLRELNQVKYYDDNFSTTPTSTKVALEAFPQEPLILIAGGRDKTEYRDLPELLEIIAATKNLHRIILIGESGRELAKLLTPNLYTPAQTLDEAINLAKQAAENLGKPAIVLMSPAAASFDMFENVYDRGAKYQKKIQELS